MIVEKRLRGEVGRLYIERVAAGEPDPDAYLDRNAYGEIVDVEEGREDYPVICGHGGSMWLCRDCKNRILREVTALPAARNEIRNPSLGLNNLTRQ